MVRVSHFDKLLADAQHEQNEVFDSLEAIASLADQEGRDVTDEEQSEIDKLTARAQKLEETVKRTKATIEQKAKLQAAKAKPEFADSKDDPSQGSQRGLTIPASVARYKSDVFESTAEAFAMGKWLQSASGNMAARQWCQANGLTARNAMEGGTDNLGGYTVPDPLAATIIRLVEEYGIFRRFARTAVMTSDTLRVPKYSDTQGYDPGGTGLSVTYPGEGGAITPSDLVFDQVSLAATKYATLALMSTELAEDSLVNMVDLIARDIATKFAFAEDLNSFSGDGTATYGGITGILNSLQAGSFVTLASTNTAVTDITLQDLNLMVGKVPEYAGLTPRWFMHKAVFYAINDLLTQLGGTTQRMFEEGPDPMLIGYPVTFTQVLPNAGAAAGSTVAYFGDLDLACYSGQRRQLWLRVLTELYAANDQIAVQATMRADSVTHSIGDANNAGAVVGLTLAAS